MIKDADNGTRLDYPSADRILVLRLMVRQRADAVRVAPLYGVRCRFSLASTA